MRQPTRLVILLAFAVLYLIWGSTYLGIRLAIDSIPPFLMAGSRYLTAGLILYGIARARGATRPPAITWRSSLIVGGFLLLGGTGGGDCRDGTDLHRAALVGDRCNPAPETTGFAWTGGRIHWCRNSNGTFDALFS